MLISPASFDRSLNSLIGRFSKDVKKIYYALIFQVLFFIVVISLTTFTSINQEQILWVVSIFGIAGIGDVADFQHLRKALQDGINDLKSLNKIRNILGAIPDMLDLSVTPNDDRQKFAVLLRTTLRKALLTSDTAALVQEVTAILQ
ncbi:hypothetical protein LCGC14_2187370 [marine sediment metagenome]|uniref:Uncharacterized protein n=1 Tax=marine sediment metagenome TaxID=412755 RepID=A0A0F9DKR2_9ZZZZ